MFCDVSIIDSHAYPIIDEAYIFVSPKLDPSQY